MRKVLLIDFSDQLALGNSLRGDVPPAPIVKNCNRGYQTLDEARHAGVAVGRDRVNTLMPQSDEVSPGRMNRYL